MAEKLQHTAQRMREAMLNRYGDGHHHKHDKLHQAYRLHSPSHPTHVIQITDQKAGINEVTGQIRAFKLRKLRKRLDKGRIH